jgi:hypothetical protein
MLQKTGEFRLRRRDNGGLVDALEYTDLQEGKGAADGVKELKTSTGARVMRDKCGNYWISTLTGTIQADRLL